MGLKPPANANFILNNIHQPLSTAALPSDTLLGRHGIAVHSTVIQHLSALARKSLLQV